jgi:hypothetical protein
MSEMYYGEKLILSSGGTKKGGPLAVGFCSITMLIILLFLLNLYIREEVKRLNQC